MEHNDHSLTPIWEKYPEIFSSENISVDAANILALISELFIVGEYYYYVIDIRQQEISHQHPSLNKIHGLEKQPTHLQEIIDLIHPDDIPFILNAEEHCSKKIAEIGNQHLKSLKSCYCFRMRTATGEYKLFHHQAITLVVDKEDRILRSLNIHTDISHLTAVNNYIATVMGINDRNDFHQMDLSPLSKENKLQDILTKRELQILPHIAQGLSSIEIAKLLEISQLTVRVHRKNILRKTQTRNSSSLIKRCIELGLL
ncbi:LuxR C-terminal-related transcriptional regulator [Sphingobacterium sp. SYP-B4668]|uniref:LuxR C-terminal-related transcriptional regulator n=1 Tax=Sphingobacterium sp. SYP-B4668 TaxID=2996035 RepID=UPI0022DDCC4E|nr:LuxR C-terminal-related transcriptional regulator [Sphingobacterium sp. SYP-B4668]